MQVRVQGAIWNTVCSTQQLVEGRGERLIRKRSVWIAFLAALAIAAGVLLFRAAASYRSVTLRGAVIRQSEDPNQQTPIAGVQVVANDGSVIASARTGASGAFSLTLQRSIIRGRAVTLSFRQREYKPFDIVDPLGDRLYVVRMAPLQAPAPPDPDKSLIHIENASVRYTMKTAATVEIGSGVKTFQVVNRGNVPCRGVRPCSPDGKWKAAVVTASLDAGQDNEFRNGRVSCIAGPCPFTKVERDDFSRGGRTIGVTVLNWSDTATFLLQAEAIRHILTESIRKSYPVIVDRTLNFSLPNSSEGMCIEAEVDGTPIVFPIGPNLSLSWAECETQSEPENNTLYRCELRPGYVFH